MTNLTDEGLMEMAGNLCYYGHEHPTPNCPTCEPIFITLQQIRDAAKKETTERVVKNIQTLRVLGKECPQTVDGIKGWRVGVSEALETAVKAIRQTDGGK